jgi:protein-S-isoprenylcysteine O-methyltransferase Ste14
VFAEALWLLAKNLFFLLLVPGTLAYWAPLRWITRSDLREVEWAPMALAGLAAAALGTFGLLWCIWHFAATGRGTPAPFDPPRRLVVRGLYRVVRNPMYLSVVIVVLGWALVLRETVLVWYAGAGWLFFHGFVVLAEEPDLRARFGEDYVAYCRAVRRWLPGRPYRDRAATG